MPTMTPSPDPTPAALAVGEFEIDSAAFTSGAVIFVGPLGELFAAPGA